MKISRTEQILLVGFYFLASTYILSSSYLGVSGEHTWRQSDVYGHILGFLNYKNFDFGDRFTGPREIFDIPIYEFLIAKASIITNSDVLATTRFLNLILWIVTAFSGYSYVNAVGKRYSGVIFVSLMSVSPLVLHYYSVPLPDVMAIAFSLLGIMILSRGNSYISVAYSLPFLAIATLIKSPVPFVFLVLHSAYFLLNQNGKRICTMETIRNSTPLLVMLLVLFLLAVAAEQLRIFLIGRDEVGFYQDQIFYFGTFQQRLSGEFWRVLWERLDQFALNGFGLIYVLTILLSLILLREKRNFIFSLSSVVAFMSGWLIFSNVYFVHDYYQLPVAVVLFLSFSVSFSFILDWLGRLPTLHIFHISTSLLILWFGILLYVYFHQPILSEKSRSDIYSSFEYALKDVNTFLYVSDDRDDDPRIGGLLSTKFQIIRPEEFEANCELYLDKFEAIVAEKSSFCLSENRQLADYYVNYKGLTFFMDSRREVGTSRSAPPTPSPPGPGSSR